MNNNGSNQNKPYTPKIFTDSTGLYEREEKEKGGAHIQPYSITSIMLSDEQRQTLIAQLSEATNPIKLEIGVTERMGKAGKPFVSSFVRSFTGQTKGQGQVVSQGQTVTAAPAQPKRTFVPKAKTA